MSAMASCVSTELTTTDYDTESANKRDDGHTEERGKEEERQDKQTKANPPHQAYPIGVCDERGPSRGTPWWPLPPLARLLEFIVIHIIGTVLASFATSASGILFHDIALYCAEHPF